MIQFVIADRYPVHDPDDHVPQDHAINMPLPLVHRQAMLGKRGKYMFPLVKTVMAFERFPYIPTPISKTLFDSHRLYFQRTVE